MLMASQKIARNITFLALFIGLLVGCKELANSDQNSTCVPTNFPENWLQIQENLGGHTIERHVGRTDQELVARLQRDTRISSASTYSNVSTATISIEKALKANANNLNKWNNQAVVGEKKVVDYNDNIVVGRIAKRPASLRNIVDSKKIRVVMSKNRQGKCFLLTSYPSK